MRNRVLTALDCEAAALLGQLRTLTAPDDFAQLTNRPPWTDRTRPARPFARRDRPYHGHAGRPTTGRGRRGRRRRVTTRHGNTMTLTDFLATRVVELAVHGLDLALALDRPPWTTPAVRRVVLDLVIPLPDAERDGAHRAGVRRIALGP